MTYSQKSCRAASSIYTVQLDAQAVNRLEISDGGTRYIIASRYPILPDEKMKIEKSHFATIKLSSTEPSLSQSNHIPTRRAAYKNTKDITTQSHFQKTHSHSIHQNQVVSPKTGAPHRNLGELVLVLDEWHNWLE